MYMAEYIVIFNLWNLVSFLHVYKVQGIYLM